MRIWGRLPPDLQDRVFKEAVTSQEEKMRPRPAIYLHEIASAHMRCGEGPRNAGAGQLRGLGRNPSIGIRLGHRHAISRIEPDRCLEAIIAPVTCPNVANVRAIAVLRGIRRHYQFAALGAGWPPEVPFVSVAHGHSHVECHNESLSRWNSTLCTGPLCHSRGCHFNNHRKMAGAFLWNFGLHKRHPHRELIFMRTLVLGSRHHTWLVNGRRWLA